MKKRRNHDPSIKLAAVNDAIGRWQRRAIRAANALAKLYRQQKRLEAAIKRPKLRTDLKKFDAHVIKPDEYKDAPELTDAELATAKVHEGGVEIPAFLRRSQPNAADEAAKAEILAGKAKRAKEKAAGKAAARKAKAKGDTRRMPLSGKAARDYINKGA